VVESEIVIQMQARRRDRQSRTKHNSVARSERGSRPARASERAPGHIVGSTLSSAVTWDERLGRQVEGVEA
jgi:hypothetical protein